MTDPKAELEAFEARHDFLVAIDSDGCAFDTMEIKHKECFIPNIIKHWNLQPVSKHARAAAEFVNLYSRWRGVNRFPALIQVFDLLVEWPEVQKRRVEIPTAQPLRDWIARETRLGNPALEAEAERTGDPVLKQALWWSIAVNEAVADLVHDVPPFPFVRESLEKVSKRAALIVCSAAPIEALRREWHEPGIADYTRVLAGQEMGSKKEHIALAAKDRYASDRILMIGDAPGDMRAAKANDARFFPINPGDEENSWKRFLDEEADRFFSGRYDATRERGLIESFEQRLPETPPWQR